jgi:hypothetical protein
MILSQWDKEGEEVLVVVFMRAVFALVLIFDYN